MKLKEAKALFEWLQREHPGRFSDGQIRTLQRRIKLWRVTEGPAREVYFGQVHVAGRPCASDFTHMTELEITLAGQTFEHLVYHFVLTYSNWETGTICYSARPLTAVGFSPSEFAWAANLRTSAVRISITANSGTLCAFLCFATFPLVFRLHPTAATLGVNQSCSPRMRG